MTGRLLMISERPGPSTQHPLVGEDVASAILASAPEGVSHLGFVAFDFREQVLVNEPEDQPFGVTATLPRVRVLPGESPVAAIGRCLDRKVGRRALSAFPIRPVWVTENSATFCFTGMVADPDERSEARTVRGSWLPLEEARSRISASSNGATRNRDFAVLVAARQVQRSLFRRILLTIRELHRMGFGRLRAAPWMHQNGYIKPPGRWSCSVVPSLVMSDTNGALTDGDRMNRMREALGVTSHHDPFETLGHHRAFGWDDALFDTPERLAEKFFERFRDLCFIGWGCDPVYERWYDEMLEATAPNGVFYPLAQNNDHVRSAFTAREDRLPAPPAARS
jgi:hypothetical protein